MDINMTLKHNKLRKSKTLCEQHPDKQNLRTGNLGTESCIRQTGMTLGDDQ